MVLREMDEMETDDVLWWRPGGAFTQEEQLKQEDYCH